MADYLAYRIPGKDLVRKTGSFKLADAVKPKEGFVVSDFEQKEVYFFEENDLVYNGLHFKSKSPYVVTKKEYIIGAETLINALSLFGLEKVVYSRIKKVEFDEAKTEKLFEKLLETYPNAFVYLISSRMFGTWLGASPEVLLSMHNQQGFVMSLAGTQPKAELVKSWSNKEITEQNFVTEYIEKKLLLLDLKEIEIHGPFDVEAGPVKHLRTGALEIAQEMHPTPAVAGVPTKLALDMLSNVENHARQLYTGFLGQLEENHSWLYVNLRCCQIQAGYSYLYVGGGYTNESIPEMEWLETEHKSKTIGDLIKRINN
jgi:isochorismate synthase